MEIPEEIEFHYQRELLDQNTCDNCNADDGVKVRIYGYWGARQFFLCEECILRFKSQGQ